MSQKEEIPFYFKSVYVIQAEDGAVKVGVSGKPESRIKNIQKASGRKIENIWFSPKCSNAFEIESEAKKHFQRSNMNGEWYSCKYQEMLEFVKSKYFQLAKLEYRKTQGQYVGKILEQFYSQNSKVSYKEELSNHSFLTLTYLYAMYHELYQSGKDDEAVKMVKAFDLVRKGMLEASNYVNEETLEILQDENWFEQNSKEIEDSYEAAPAGKLVDSSDAYESSIRG